MMAEGVTMAGVLGDMLRRPKLVRPQQPLPFVKEELNGQVTDQPRITWFGHSSYLLQCRGYNILVDPVLSGYASPVPGMIRAFDGADEYKAADFPAIDLMIITHNHYDHLDSSTIKKLKGRTQQFVTGMGVGRDLARCGVDQAVIEEMDWWESYSPAPGIELVATPARHFSGRGLVRGGSLWSGFVLNFFGISIFIGGDSGYDTFFKTIGEKYGPFKLAVLECGQYDVKWPAIHMMPEETVMAATDLRTEVVLPVHWGKFTLASHLWNEPPKRLLEAARGHDLRVVIPKIGEGFLLGGPFPEEHWWEF